jgi:hypothetical protein
VHVATDLGWLYEEMRRILTSAGFAPVPDVPAPDRPTTRFERKYARAGTFGGSFALPDSQAAGAPSPSPQKNS